MRKTVFLIFIITIGSGCQPKQSQSEQSQSEQAIDDAEDKKIVTGLFMERFSYYQYYLKEKNRELPSFLRNVLNDIRENQELTWSQEHVLTHVDSILNSRIGSSFTPADQEMLEEARNTLSGNDGSYVQKLSAVDDVVISSYLNRLGDGPSSMEVQYLFPDTIILEPGRLHKIPVQIGYEDSGAGTFTILTVNRDTFWKKEIEILTPNESNRILKIPNEYLVKHNLTRENFTIRDTIVVVTK